METKKRNRSLKKSNMSKDDYMMYSERNYSNSSYSRRKTSKYFSQNICDTHEDGA